MKHLLRSGWGRRAMALLLPLLVAGAAHAQVSTGNIYTTVTDDQGAPLPGVTVTVSGLGAPQIQVTDAQGQARFFSLAPGNYHLEAALQGFSTLIFETVNVRTNQNTQLELKLSPAVEDVITVTAESPLLDERKIATGAAVNSTELEKVPSSRDPWAVLGTVPGVKTDRINVGGNESGQQSQYVGPGSGGDQAVWAVDGVVITDMGAIGSSPTYYNFDAFEEMQVSTGGTDTSLATGGVTLNMVTKRGTNEWRGSGRYITADDSWQSDTDVEQSELGSAGPWNAGGTATGGSAAGNPQPIFKQGNRIVSIEDWGVEVGGPIVKDRLWIWGNYGKQDVELLTISDFSDATQLDTYGAKLNAQVTSSNSAILFYNYGDKQKQGRNAGPLRPQPTTWNQVGPSDIYKLEDTQIFGSNLYLTGMVSYVGGGFELHPQGGLNGKTTILDNASGVWQNNFYDHVTDRPQSQARLDGSYFFSTGDLNHELKFGAGYRTVDLDSTTTWPTNGLVITNAFGDPDIQLFQAVGVKNVSLTTDYWSAFLQDTLTVGRLTANVGLRFDRQSGEINAANQPATPGYEALGLVGATAPSRDQGFTWSDITPRLGITYALGAERKTLLRASYSRFADQLAQGFTAWRSTAAYRYLYFYNTSGSSLDVNGDGIVSAAENNFWASQGGFLGDNLFDPTQTRTFDVVDPDFSAPLTDEILLSAEHALLPEFVVGVNLTLRNLHNTAESERLVFCQTGETGCFLDEYGNSVRLDRRDDYVEQGVITTVRPDGSTFSQPFYGLREGVEDTSGDYLTNGDREQNYVGASLTFNKRLANRWMLRGNFSWSDWEWDIPESERQDPNSYLGGGNEDGEPVLQGSGTGSGSKGSVYINSNWSYDLTGLYQIAPDRPWGFNVSGHVYGREGYPIPYFRRAPCPTGFQECAGGGTYIALQATEDADDFRNPDIHLMDLRLEKDFVFSDWTFTVLGEVFNVFNNNDALQTQHRLYTAGTVVQTEPGQGGPDVCTNQNQPGCVRTAAGDYVTEVVSPRVFRLGARVSFR